MKGHNNPRCLKWGDGRPPSRSGRIRRVSPAVKRVGELSELSTTVWGSTRGWQCQLKGPFSRTDVPNSHYNSMR
jgi:hypothetical protein